MKQRRPRRSVAVGAAALLVAVATWRVVAGGGDDTAATLAGLGAPAGPVVSYTIVYETIYDGDPLQETVEVERPFRSRVESGTSVQISDAGVFATSSDGDEWLRLEVPIAPATSDLRPLAALDDVVAAGQVELLDDDASVRGRACRMFLLGGPTASGAFTPIDAIPGESAEVCIDDLGLVLWEAWTIDGDVVRTREATSIRFESIPADRFAVPDDATELAFDDGGGAVEPIAADEDPGFLEYWLPGSIPDGFEFVDRWAVVPPALEAANSPVPRSADIGIVTDAWVRGSDLLVIDQGAANAGVGPPWDPTDAGVDLDDLGELGSGRLIADLQFSEVRVERTEGGFVRVAGTLPPDELVDVARALTLSNSGEAS